jgi:CubicO group peptidase (beta-lactamase class C family)
MDPVAPALQDVFARSALTTHAPAIAWGLVRDGSLVGHGGVGTLRADEDAPPGADSVFRIASMTKSFSGAALMTLVVDGQVRLDEPVATYVPELAGWRGPTADGPPLTIRHLASMESGLPTDDPWADRHMDITDAEMDALIEAGAAFAWTPGVAFEYSNLGWGLIGRVIQRVSGSRAQDLVTERLLGPLGMSSTTWTRPGTADLAEPYRWEEGRWRHEGEPVGDGGIAPMGGLWSTVRDLARWVAFFQDAWPPRDDPDDGPLPRWARREMQQIRRFDAIERRRPRPSGPSRTVALGYGIGLGIRVDERLGVSVGHSGGLPGYGSHMRWLPDHGVGVIALANVTYGAMHDACVEAIDVLADLDALGPVRAIEATPLSEAADRAVALVNAWDDETARGLLAGNAEPDEPFERRARQAASVVERHGALAVEHLEADTPLRGAITAAGGGVKVDLGLHHAGSVQWLDIVDRTRPSEDPIVTDAEHLRRVAGTAYVIVRPVADLADAFARWQGEVLDRLGGSLVAPAAHVTLKTFGTAEAPIAAQDEARLIDVVGTWAASTAPIELRATSLDAWEGDEAVPVVVLAPIAALAALWDRCADAALPAGYGDRIGVSGWIPHCSLAYPKADPDAALWAALRAWLRGVVVDTAACTSGEAELLVFDGGPGRVLGRFPFGG